MAEVLKVDDFSDGDYKIATNSFQTKDLEKSIEKWSRHYLIRLFGPDLYPLFIADLDTNGEPQSTRFVSVFDAFAEKIDCELCDSEGIKEMLKGFVYFHFERYRPTRSTTNGPKQSKGENSQNLDNVSSNLVQRFNGAVTTFECIQKKMCEENDTYPEYDGIKVERILFI